ncbi:methyltransferase domain protein [Fusarium subglutinans]|uniref:Methyltransferase domain protein n=1 Tax=Gibberella subglutinans TaxID=42677 RepID=A0A8H5P4D1_GIBSU|nr:methyltransferase domain protein [Fusarium subglutinans]KAF5587708.1 methyltransferase domain protein [Fusarium subglutinans]
MDYQSGAMSRAQCHSRGTSERLVTSNAHTLTSVASVRDLKFGRELVNYARQALNGIAAKGEFEWIHSHEDVEKHCDILQKEVDDGVSVMGYEVRWTIGRKPE